MARIYSLQDNGMPNHCFWEHIGANILCSDVRKSFYSVRGTQWCLKRMVIMVRFWENCEVFNKNYLSRAFELVDMEEGLTEVRERYIKVHVFIQVSWTQWNGWFYGCKTKIKYSDDYPTSSVYRLFTPSPHMSHGMLKKPANSQLCL